MATSYYEFLETRTYIYPDCSEAYIRISDANDFMPIGGWYKKTVGVDTPILTVLLEAMQLQSFLTDWDRGSPPA